MKYTKYNIEGIIFLGTTDPYIIIKVKENNQVEMGYHPSHYGYESNNNRTFENSLDVILKYLNNGTWKPIYIPEPQYQIY